MTAAPGPTQRFSSTNVISVSYNNADTIAEFLASLVAQDSTVAQVVVRDNGSSDGTVALLSAAAESGSVVIDGETVALTFPVSVQVGGNVGFGAGLYAAAQQLTAPQLPTLCLNPDLVLAPGTIAPMLDVLAESGRVGIVTTPLVDEFDRPDTGTRRTLPTVGGSIGYALLGKFLPRRFRYNSTVAPVQITNTASGVPYSTVEATSGAVMLIAPDFRPATGPIFDLDYWMHCEDLQLCLDAGKEGWGVAIAEVPPSLHYKGISSGKPRKAKADIAFHRSLALYFRKNLAKGAFSAWLITAGVYAKLVVSIVLSGIVRSLRAVRRAVRGRQPAVATG